MKVFEHKMLSFSVRKEIIENDDSFFSYFIVQSRRKRHLSDFIANLQSRTIKSPSFTNAQIREN